MAFGSLLLDDQADLMGATYDDGSETIAAALGAQQVAQAAAIAVSVPQGAVWFNLSGNIDFDGLFYAPTLREEELGALRANAYRSAILSVPGIEGFADSDVIEFDTSGNRRLGVNIPCVLIDCENSRTRTFIEVINS